MKRTKQPRRKLFSKFKISWSFRKILLVFVLFSALLSSVLIANSHYQSTQNTKQIAMNTMRLNLLQAKEYMDYRMREMDLISSNFCTDLIISTALEQAIQASGSQAPDLDIYYQLKPHITNMVINYRDYQFKIYLDDQIFLTAEEVLFFPISSIQERDWYLPTLHGKGAPQWTTERERAADGYVNQLSLTRSMRSFFTNIDLGILRVSLSICSFLNTLQNAIIIDGGIAALITDNGTMIHSVYSDGRFKSEPMAQTAIDLLDKGMLRAEVSLDYTGMKLVALTPIQSLQEQMTDQFYQSILLILIMTGFLLLSVGLASYLVQRRISVLGDKLENIEVNEFNSMIDSIHSDEFSRIENSFDRMSIRIKHLISEVYDLELRRRETELIILYEQIKPHFLYNILDSINWMALEGDVNKISKVVSALGKFYRLSLSAGQETVSFQTEIEIAQQYVFLQQARYNDTIHATFDISPETYGVTSPKLLLQPIIENAIKHGILPMLKKQKGQLFIRAWCLDGTIYVNVINNGKELTGIVKKTPANKNHKNGYGWDNVRKRMQLLYDEDYTLGIFTNEMGYTEVDISWPAVPYADD